MKKNIICLLAGILALSFVIGCGNGNQSFFKDSVTVAPWRVNQGLWRESHLVFKFNKVGTYDISFSRPAGYEDYQASFLPKNYRKVVADPAQEEEISFGGLRLSKRVIVTIKKSDQTEAESHEFDLEGFNVNHQDNSPGW